MIYKKFQRGGRPGSVLAERGEVYQDEEGIKKVSEDSPTHDDNIMVHEDEGYSHKTSNNNGGVVIEADTVLSATHENRNSNDSSYGIMDEAIKVKSKELDEYALSLGIKKINNRKSVSPSKAFELLRDSKLKLASKFLENKQDLFSDSYTKSSIKANEVQAALLPQDQDIYDYMFQVQESKKNFITARQQQRK